MKYFIWTIGCQMNTADSRNVAARLEAYGLKAAAKMEEADLVVLNTCVVRQQAESKALSILGMVHELKDQKPGLIIGLMGCLVGVQGDHRLPKRFPFVDAFMPPSDPEPLLDLLRKRNLVHDESADSQPARVFDSDGDFELPSLMKNAAAAHVPIVLGCSHACSFCVIPYRRGAEKSRPMKEVIAEVRALVQQGIREVTLLGQIVDRYGLDFGDGTNLCTLIREIEQIDDLLRIRFLTSHPSFLTDELIDTVATSKKVCPHIEVPLQAGDDEVLKNMRRGYTAEDYRKLIARIRAAIPDVAIFTDLIVGFPGETEEQFMGTYRMMDELKLDMAHIARYSERPKTYAALRLKDDVPADEKNRRHTMLNQQLKNILLEKHKDYVGRKFEVLVEGYDAKKNRWFGRTPQNKLVFFEDERNLQNQLVEAEVIWAGPFVMLGKTTDHKVAHESAR